MLLSATFSSCVEDRPSDRPPSSEPVTCSPGTWDDDADPTTPCAPWTDCPAGTYVAARGSATSDRRCEPCAEGTFSTDVNAARCEPWTACPAGTSIRRPGSATTDRQCAPCTAETWDHDADPSTSCIPWRDCVPGEYVREPGSATRDRACEPCGAGAFSATENARNCVPHSPCAPGTEQIRAGSATQDRECAPCPHGTWDHDARFDTACVEWRTCQPGEFVAAAGSPTSDRGCAPCEPGTFSADTNADRCEPWSDCEPGTYVALAGRPTADRVCAACPAGTTSVTKNAASCIPAPTVLAVGEAHTCLLDKGILKCWGANHYGQLGLGDNRHRGDAPGEMGEALPAVDLGAGRAAIDVAAGAAHTCALLDDGTVKCWGANDSGQLGLGDVLHRGDDPQEMGDHLPVVPLGKGRRAKAIAVGAMHSCALLDDGAVKCWGLNETGQLGQGDTNNRGDQPGEMGDALPEIDLGAGSRATAIAAGLYHTCALLDDAAVKCWGGNEHGQLGLGDMARRGDGPGEMGDDLPAVELGEELFATAIAAGTSHTCALLGGGGLKCWGFNQSGQLGLGDTCRRGEGPNEMGDSLPEVALGAGLEAVAIAAGSSHTCALLDDGGVKCWGSNHTGELGQGDTRQRGDEPQEMGDSLPEIDLGSGRRAIAVSAGATHTCALLDDGTVKCWGGNTAGQLGLGDTLARGDEPGEMGDALPAVDPGRRDP